MNSGNSEYELYLAQVNTLQERRQNATAIYLSVNAALTGAMAFLFKDGQLTNYLSEIAVFTLLFSGVVACGLWRRIISQYSTLIDWWYTQIRHLEKGMPEKTRIITKEFHELYAPQTGKKRVVGLTRYEIALTWLFTAIYGIFGAVILTVLLVLLIHAR